MHLGFTSNQWQAAFDHVRQYFQLKPADASAYIGLQAATEYPLNDPLLSDCAQSMGLTMTAAEFVADANTLPWIVADHDDLLVITEFHAGTAKGQRFSQLTEGVACELSMAQLAGDGVSFQLTGGIDQRSSELLAPLQRHWLHAALLEAKPWYRDLLLASLVVNILALLLPLFTMNVYDRVVPNHAYATLWVLAVGVLIALGFDWALRLARSRITDMAGRQIDVQVSQTLYQKMLGMKLRLRPQSTGAFAKQMQEVDTVREFLTSATLVALVDLPFAVIFLVLIYWLAGPLVVIPLVGLLGLIAVALWVKGPLRAAIEQTGQLATQKQAQLIEALHNLVHIKQLNSEASQVRRWRHLSGLLADQGIVVRHASNRLTHSVQLVQGLVTVALLVGGVYRIAEGLMSMGAMIAIVMLSGRAAQALSQLAVLLLRFEQTQAALQGLDTVMALEQENQRQPVTQMALIGHCKLNQVSFSYPQQNESALQRIDLQLEATERVALLGASGSGKSTLLAMLAGQFEPISGVLSYDEVELQQWPLSQLRSQFGFMAQESVLFWGSVLENITQSTTAIDEDRLRELLRALEFDQHMSQLPNGLQSPVGELGRAVSGGQRQLIALARTLYAAPSKLLLDEPTSAMDERMQATVINTLDKLPQQTGFVIATHKPTVLQICDRVLVLDRGAVVVDQSRDDFLRAHQTVHERGRDRKVTIRQRTS